jgi:dienelactone hydrolase
MSALRIAITAAVVVGVQELGTIRGQERGVAATQAAGHDSIATQTLLYRHGDVVLRGYLAYDKSVQGKRPGVLVVHEWWGLNDFAKEKARQIAQLGYVALAVDMYGDGQVTTDPAEAGRLAGQFRENTTLWRQRIRAAYDALADNEHCDPARIAAIGFCFGGSTVLQLAASGTDVAAVVSFHGGLIPITEPDASRIRARILVLHGAADPHVTDESVKTFEDTLRKTDVDWQITIYSGAQHGFMNPAASKLGMEGISYDERTAQRAWGQMRLILQQTFEGAHK